MKRRTTTNRRTTAHARRDALAAHGATDVLLVTAALFGAFFTLLVAVSNLTLVLVAAAFAVVGRTLYRALRTRQRANRIQRTAARVAGRGVET